MQKGIIRFIHSLPVAWLPTPGKRLMVDGISADKVAELCKGREIVSHIRYPSHCEIVSAELGIDLKESGENAQSPFNLLEREMLILAITVPGTTRVQYMVCWDATAARRLTYGKHPIGSGGE